jgi:hypothetical protein
MQKELVLLRRLIARHGQEDRRLARATCNEKQQAGNPCPA